MLVLHQQQPLQCSAQQREPLLHQLLPLLPQHLVQLLLLPPQHLVQLH